MALVDLMASRFAHSSVVVTNHLDDCLGNGEDVELYRLRDLSEAPSTSGGNVNVYVNAAATSSTTATSIVYLPQTIVLCELRHEGFEDSVPTGPAESGLVSKWRPKDRVRLLGSLL